MDTPRFQYRPPDFSGGPLRNAPDASFVPMPPDGVLPDGFFSTTNLPTYVRVQGVWRRPASPRMDCVVVFDGTGLSTVEPRRLAKGTPAAVGEAEDGSQGISLRPGRFDPR